jgi:hypothetical protein
MRGTKTLLAGILCLSFFGASIFSVNVTPEGGYEGGWSEKDKFNSEVARSQDKNLHFSIPEEWKGKGAGETRLLHEDYEKVHGEAYTPRTQGPVPTCVGQAVAAAVDFLAAAEIVGGDRERAPPAPASAEVIYGLSRQEIGQLGPKVGGGSMNIWAVQAIQEYGVVARLNYPLIGQDLRQPSAKVGVEFGRKGIPTGLEIIARLHPVKEYYSVNSYEDVRDALYQGCPVVIGSKQGFGNGVRVRDDEGFLNPPRRLFFPSIWRHAMVCIGVCDEGRPGILMLNSWGSKWLMGPHRFEGTPEGAFFVDASIITRMVEQKDSYAIEGFRGYREYRIWNDNNQRSTP